MFADADPSWMQRPAQDSSGNTACFNGIVNDNPVHESSSPARKPASPPPDISMASYVQSRPSAA